MKQIMQRPTITEIINLLLDSIENDNPIERVDRLIIISLLSKSERFEDENRHLTKKVAELTAQLHSHGP